MAYDPGEARDDHGRWSGGGGGGGMSRREQANDNAKDRAIVNDSMSHSDHEVVRAEERLARQGLTSTGSGPLQRTEFPVPPNESTSDQYARVVSETNNANQRNVSDAQRLAADTAVDVKPAGSNPFSYATLSALSRRTK